MKYFMLLFFVSLFFSGCPLDNRVSTRYTERRIIKNSSTYEVRLKQFYFPDISDSTISPGDSIIFSARCTVTGGWRSCGNPEYSYAFAVAEEDSVHIIFNKKKVLKYNRENFVSCLDRNILISTVLCGYTVNGRGTDLTTYTYEISDADYDNAEPVDG